MLTYVLISLCVGGIVAQDNPCEGVDDDVVVEHGCRSYTICQGGEPIIIDCDEGLVFNPEIEECDDPENVGPPCGLWRDCSYREDGRYRDFETNCTAYFTCLNEGFYGHNPCSPGLVFDPTPEMCLCNWIDASPPCLDDDSFCPLDSSK